MTRKSWLLVLLSLYVVFVGMFFLQRTNLQFEFALPIYLTLLFCFTVDCLLLLFVGIFSLRRHPMLSILSILVVCVTLALTIYSSISRVNPIGYNSAVKANLANIRAQAALLYELNQRSYEIVCADDAVSRSLDTVEDYDDQKTPVRCFSDKDSFVVGVKLRKKEEPSNLQYYCIDSTRVMKGISEAQFNFITNSNTLCS